ncbi:hypothetical protein [Bacteroides bouchesdurhonensis]
MVEAENIKLHRSTDKIKLRQSQSDVIPIITALNAGFEKIIKNANHLHFGDLMNIALHYICLMAEVNYRPIVWMFGIQSII